MTWKLLIRSIDDLFGTDDDGDDELYVNLAAK
jgi:hypothetical protein